MDSSSEINFGAVMAEAELLSANIDTGRDIYASKYRAVDILVRNTLIQAHKGLFKSLLLKAPFSACA